jgi:hypothetical protein
MRGGGIRSSEVYIDKVNTEVMNKGKGPGLTMQSTFSSLDFSNMRWLDPGTTSIRCHGQHKVLKKKEKRLVQNRGLFRKMSDLEAESRQGSAKSP